MTEKKEYEFDFSKLTALDIGKLVGKNEWMIVEVINKCIAGGLEAYGPDEFDPIVLQFAIRIRARVNMPKATVSWDYEHAR